MSTFQLSSKYALRCLEHGIGRLMLICAPKVVALLLGGTLRLWTSNLPIERRMLWSDLDIHKNVVWGKVWVLLGDFNVALNLEDSFSSSSQLTSHMLEFKDCAYAIFQPYRISDHSPVVLKIPDLVSSKPKPFKFCNFLTFKSSFLDTVSTFWNVQVDGHNLYQIASKLMSIKKPFRKLLHEQGNLHDRVNRLRHELDGVQKALDNNPADSNLRDEEAIYLKAFNKAKVDEERFLKQKTKIDWLDVGDSNSAYFHKSVKSTSMHCDDLNVDGLFTKTISDEVVSENQSAFVPGRRIADNILITQELMHNYHHDRAPPRRIADNILKCFVNVCFADDLFIFARGDVESTRVIMELIDEFKSTSGLVPSLPKSTTFFCNVCNHVKIAILNIMQFSEGKLSVKYLGVPLISSKLLIRDCSFGVTVNIIGVNQRWIHTYKLRDRSFWDIPLKADISWGWRKILKLCDTIWPHAWLLKAPNIGTIQAPNLAVHVPDVTRWCDANGNMLEFSSLKTQDKVKQWDIGNNDLNLLSCPLCKTQADSHAHLFFECSFSQQVWSLIRHLASMENVLPILHDIVMHLLPLSHKRTTRSIVRRLILAADAYHVWIERNNRLFKNAKRTPEDIRDMVMVTVWLKLITLRFKNTLSVSCLLEKWKMPCTFRLYGS
ncbi:reverse transcriptase domain, reverse transcriptase zinc-binding domain protein [Tanacetum coccineum]|uniref:Reverse transcriptase domain, reverse transcriptase zinc-binding domain protein n=1 Tax=Tanacetum coccineum TaxID=301880 RepID=A0ABQ5DDC5_9ASTR